VPGGRREELIGWLRERGIESAVHYPRSLPAHPLYRDLGYEQTSFPVAQRLADEVLSLPVHHLLSRADLDAVVDAVNAWAKSLRPVAR
jgi:UDP-2-acetamido-2-deoxy-ribo-hexuluronate aminotransferase